MTQEPLAPCALCGGTASHENYITEAVVCCTDCGATITRRHAPEWDSGAPAAIAAWNRRSHPATGRPTREEVKAFATRFVTEQSEGEWGEELIAKDAARLADRILSLFPVEGER